MGIRFTCPSGHKLHVKAFLAGKRGVCPHCGAKFVIPTVQGAEQSPLRPAVEGHFSGTVEAFTSTGIAAPPHTTSASIIIATTDDRLAAEPPVDDDTSAMRLADSFGPPKTADPPAPPSQPAIVMADSVAESPAVWHVSRRQRHRRKQLNMAIVLLVAVILLALVLIWVLQRGASQPSVGEIDTMNRYADVWRAAVLLQVPSL